jgi:catechol 2,3-dioxygenase-like lactoylglutathione lyase family enzyme
MALKRLDNIGIVVDDLELTIDFFQELGLHLEGRARSKENGQDVSPDLPISASRLP